VNRAVAAAMDWTAIENEIETAVGRGAFPGAVLLVNRGAEVVYHRALGYRSLEPERTPMHPDTIFDLSSLTKPLATAAAFLCLASDGRVRLEDRVTRFFPDFGVHGKTHVEFRHLLAHCSGLPAWRPYYREIVKMERRGRLNFIGSVGARQFAYEQIHRERPEYPPMTRAVYSDLGFMLLGELVEELSGLTLDRFCHERLFKPLDLQATSFIDLRTLRLRKLEPVAEMIAPTERCPWRKRILCGEVHDDNAYAMGGVAGHAGLFSSARDVDVLVSRWKACYRGTDDFFPPELVRRFWTREGTVAGSTWAHGWDTPSPEGSSAGRHFGARSVGHLGFSGTSVWIDLDRDVHVILLTNRVHPSRDNERIREVRPRLHDLVMETLG
jgi:CubicO group peptidase (beta-lactamase class C family)